MRNQFGRELIHGRNQETYRTLKVPPKSSTTWEGFPEQGSALGEALLALGALAQVSPYKPEAQRRLGMSSVF